MIDWSSYKPPYPALPLSGEETADIDLRKKYDANFWAYHEFWLRAEGIENFVDWLEKVEMAFPDKSRDVRSFWDQALAASVEYRHGRASFEEYQEAVSDWAVFCSNLAKRLQGAMWI